MRKITQEATQAFLNNTPFKKQNTAVEVLPNVTILKLHSHPIAYLYHDPERTLSITTANYPNNTTKEHLNALPKVHVYHKKWELYLNNKPWDWSLIDIPLSSNH